MPRPSLDLGRTKGGAVVDAHRTEDELVCAAQAGGTWAFARLWKLLAPTVAAYVRNRGVASPDDVTSEVFLAAFARIGSFQGDGAQFRRFLFTLAHHKSVDDIRRRFGPRIPSQALPAREEDLPSSPSAEDVALHGELTPRIAALVTALPPTQREVLLLRVVAGLDLSDVAAIVGRSEGAVKQLQHRALSSMRSQLIDVDSLADSPTQHVLHATPAMVDFLDHPSDPQVPSSPMR